MFFDKNKSGDKYKFKDLKVYAYDRAMGERRKFRKLYECSELTYISAELSIYNKLFDEEDWETEIKMIAFKIEDKNGSNFVRK